jgi:hypothetical protein
MALVTPPILILEREGDAMRGRRRRFSSEML